LRASLDTEYSPPSAPWRSHGLRLDPALCVRRWLARRAGLSGPDRRVPSTYSRPIGSQDPVTVLSCYHDSLSSRFGNPSNPSSLTEVMERDSVQADIAAPVRAGVCPGGGDGVMASKNATAPTERAKRGHSRERDREVRGLLIRMNSEGLRALRQLALDKDRTLQALGIEAFNDLLRKYGAKSVLENPLLAPRS
jgi:hypothetical protein